MQVSAFGIRYFHGRDQPDVSWFPTKESRDLAIETIRDGLIREASNEEALVHSLVKLSDESTYVEEGPPALHVQWRRTLFRSSHSEMHTYRNQVALVDVIGGRVLIVEQQDPFNASDRQVWNKSPCLEEISNVNGKPNSFWPPVRMAAPSENCHYVVVDREDLWVLKNQSNISKMHQGSGPYPIPAL